MSKGEKNTRMCKSQSKATVSMELFRSMKKGRIRKIIFLIIEKEEDIKNTVLWEIWINIRESATSSFIP